MKKSLNSSMLFLFLFFLISCNQNKISELEQQLSETQSELEDAEGKIAEMQEYIENLQTSVDDLRNEVDDFEYENWRYNVYDVEDATSNLEMALENLKSVAF